MIKDLEQKQTDNRRNHRNRNEISKLPSLRMFPSLENKPDTKEIIGYDSTARREDITERIFDTIQIIFTRKNSRKINA